MMKTRSKLNMARRLEKETKRAAEQTARETAIAKNRRVRLYVDGAKVFLVSTIDGETVNHIGLRFALPTDAVYVGLFDGRGNRSEQFSWPN